MRCPREDAGEVSSSGAKSPSVMQPGPLWKRELQLALLQDKEVALAKTKREIEVVWQMNHDEGMEVKACWAASTPADRGTHLLKRL